MININGRLHSTEKKVNVVAGADEILDDTKNMKQSDINSDFESRIIALHAQDYLYYDATNDDTSIETILPSIGITGKIYRIANWNANATGIDPDTYYNTAYYSEYAWDANASTPAYTLLSVSTSGVTDIPAENDSRLITSRGVKSAIDNVAFSTNEKVNMVGIDAKPTAGSENLVKSGGAFAIESLITGVIFPTKTLSVNTDIVVNSEVKEGDVVIIKYYGDGLSRPIVAYTLVGGVETPNTLTSGTATTETSLNYTIPSNFIRINAYRALTVSAKKHGIVDDVSKNSDDIAAVAEDLQEVSASLDKTDDKINGILFRKATTTGRTTLITSDDVTVGDTIIIKGHSDGYSRSLLVTVNGTTTTLVLFSSITEQTIRYVIPAGFEMLEAATFNITVSVELDGSFLNINNIVSCAFGFTDNVKFNKFVKELFVIGANSERVYKIEAVRARTVDNMWSITITDTTNGNPVAKYESPIIEINSNAYGREKDFVIHGGTLNSSGIEFYAIVDWDALQTNTAYTGGYNVTVLPSAYTYKNSPNIAEYLCSVRNVEYLDVNSFNYRISYPWSGFISLDNVEFICYSLHKIYNEITFYFYKNEMSSYSSNYLNADYILSYPSSNVARGKIIPPKGYKYFSFRVSNKENDFVFLIKGQGGFDVEKNIKFVNSAKCISNGFVPACGEPNLLYDKETGIVYENYICGENYSADPEGNFGFAKFPLASPEHAEFSIAAVFDQTEIDGETITFRDVLNYFYNATTIRNITYGKKGTSEKALYRFDQNLDGVIQNFEKIKFTDNTDVNYTSYNDKIESLGCTPYPAPSESDEHYKLLWPSSSHIQEYNGYKYFTLNGTGNCPLICRTSDNFETIEAIKAFQIECHYESALVINNNDWYVFIRGTDFIHYSCSQDGGVTWSTLQTITNSNNSKPRAIMYDGKVVALIPTQCVEDIGNVTKNNKDSVLVRSRYSVEILRGDKATDINSWQKELALASKYGQDYGDIFTVGKDLYYAWSCNMTHIDTLPIAGKSQIMFTKIGNLDNSTMFGDV